MGQPTHKYWIMPRLSLYRPNRTNDYRFFDRTISEMYTIGGCDIFVHKYLGPKTGTGDPVDSGNFDPTQPNYTFEDPLFIQDVLLGENRDIFFPKLKEEKLTFLMSQQRQKRL